MTALPVAGRSPSRHLSRCAAFAVALVGLGGLIVVAIASMLWPVVEDRSDVDVPYDPDGPVAQRFHASDLDGWLVRQPDGRVRAFSAAEPRTGCPIHFVRPADPSRSLGEAGRRNPAGYFRDPCWGSNWTLDGRITFGPSWRGMDEFEVRRANSGRVSLDLGRVRLGICAPGVRGLDCSEADAPRYTRPQIVMSGVFW